MIKLKNTKPLKMSYWQERIVASSPSKVLTGKETADVAIIGGGFVGLWTAITIKYHEPDCEVVILEQDACGSGASGRNGGFVMSWWPKIGTIKTICSKDEALFLGRAAERAIYELGEFCQENNIDAHYVQKGWLWTATTQAHVDSWNGTLKACESLGVKPFERISGEELRRRTGSPKHLAGVYEASNATVQPAALAEGMRRVALEKGVRIYERSGVNAIHPGSPVVLETTHGAVNAAKVVLATNAWSAEIPQLAKLITPVNSSVVVTQALGDKLDEMGWVGGESITDSQLMVDYYRTTRDGRIAFGKGTGAISYGGVIDGVFSHDPSSIEMTRGDLLNTYPSLDGVEITNGWSGPIDRTFDSLPVFGRLNDIENIFYGIGWSGNGVGPSRIGGRILASLALDKEDEWSTSALVNRSCKTFPPEPFRYVGGNLVRNAVIKKERAEMQGKKPGFIEKVLASLAPAGLEDKT